MVLSYCYTARLIQTFAECQLFVIYCVKHCTNKNKKKVPSLDSLDDIF